MMRLIARSVFDLRGLVCIAALVSSGCGHAFVKHEYVTLTAAAGERLVLENMFGDVELRADPKATEIRADVTKIGKGPTVKAAEEALAEIELELRSKEGHPQTLIANAKHPKSHAWRSYEVRWRITAPPNVALDIQSRFGDVEASGFENGVKLSTEFGEIEARAAGDVELKTDFGDIELRVLPGRPGVVTALTRFGDVDVELPTDRKGRLVADTNFGDVRVDLAGVNVKITRNRRHFFDAELGGSAEPKIDLTTDFGDVVVKSYRPAGDLAAVP